MRLKRVLIASYDANRRLTSLLWSAGWMIPLAVIGLTISVPFWRGVVADTQATIAQQVDYEDGVLCSKFGFIAGTDKYTACMLELLDLRHRHEELLATVAIP
jgi:hypothetical protein